MKKKKKSKQPRCGWCGRFCKRVDQIYGVTYVEWKCPNAHYEVSGSSDDGWQHD